MQNVTGNLAAELSTESDPLSELLRKGAKALISEAVEAELVNLLDAYESVKLSDGRRAVVRNGYLPERTV